ncbi:MAG: hypothetical protein KDA50_03255 [Rhodobacteraceae bacterium]|nr:hypothetical protein [Paracoccaceae bacterium]
MKRHILDKPKSRTNSGLKLSFSRIELNSLPHQESLLLQRRPRRSANSQRLREFARIERGYLA